MQAEQETTFVNKVSEKDLKELVRILFYSIMDEPENDSKSKLNEKNIIINVFSDALKQVLKAKMPMTKQDHLKVIKLLDKFQEQREAIQFAGSDVENLKVAAERLGKKAQSAFS